MFETALFIYGVCFILIDSVIFTPVREHITKIPFFEKLFNCYFCMGFWTSAAVWFAQNQPLPSLAWPSIFSFSRFVGCYASLTLGIHLLFSLLEGLAAFLAYRLGGD